MNVSLDMLSIRERLSFLSDGIFQGFVDSSIRMRTQDSYDFVEKRLRSLFGVLGVDVLVPGRM